MGIFSPTDTTKLPSERPAEMPPRGTMGQLYPDLTTPEMVDDSYLSLGELKEAFRLDNFPAQFSSVIIYIDQTL